MTAKNIGFRASRCNREGHWFESSCSHQKMKELQRLNLQLLFVCNQNVLLLYFIFIKIGQVLYWFYQRPFREIAEAQFFKKGLHLQREAFGPQM